MSYRIIVRITCFIAVGLICGLGVQGQTESKIQEEPKLPGSTRGLQEYLANTVWDLKGGGIFRFRGDSTMVMPWHEFSWKATGNRTAVMFTHDWHWDIKFSQDMKTLEVPGRYEGKQVKRLISAVNDKRLEEILTTNKWSHAAKENSYIISFSAHGKVMDTEKGWKLWEIRQGLLILKGNRDGKDQKEEFILLEDKKPYRLGWADGGDSNPKLEQK